MTTITDVPAVEVTLPPVPRWAALAVRVVCGGVLISALAAAPASLMMGSRPVWGMFGFEVVIVIASAMGLFIRGRLFRDGPALGLLCIAGAVMAGSGLGYLSLGGGMRGGQLGATSMLPLVGVRVLAAGTLGLLAAGIVLSRDSGRWRTAIRGVLLLAPVVVGAGLWWVGVLDPMVSAIGGMPGVFRALILLCVSLIAGTLLCAGLHVVIRSFEPRAERV